MNKSTLFFLLFFSSSLWLLVSCWKHNEPDPNPISAGFPTHAQYDFTQGQAQAAYTEYRNRIPSPDEVAITLKYYELAEQWVGKFPVDTISALMAQLMPVLRTKADGTVDTLTVADLKESTPRFRQSGEVMDAARAGLTPVDRPSLIFRDMANGGSVPGSRIMRYSTDSVDWVIIFRKGSRFFEDPYLYEENGIIAYNRNSGKTVFFAGSPSWDFTFRNHWRLNTNRNSTPGDPLYGGANILAGLSIPRPESNNPNSVKNWAIPIGDGCQSCHSAGPFVSFPFTDYAGYTTQGAPVYYTQPVSQQLGRYLINGDSLYGHNVVPMRTPGMLYEPLLYQTDPRFRQWWATYAPSNPDDPFYIMVKNTLEATPEKLESLQARRLVNAEVQACRTCHEVGNMNYLQRFPIAAFWLPQIDSQVHDLHERVLFYRANQTDEFTRRKPSATDQFGRTRQGNHSMAGFHNQRLDWTPLRNHSLGSNAETHYTEALAYIAQLLNEGEAGAQYADHWTLENLQGREQEYLNEQCSYCHGSGNEAMLGSNLRLETDRDYRAYFAMRPENREGLISRLQTPNALMMPPAGQLPLTVREKLVAYLRSL